MSESWQDKLKSLLADMPEEICADEPAAQAEPTIATHETARLDIILNRKGRAGKSATIISGFTMPDADIEALAANLKRSLGTGGSARGGEILIQGDRRSDVLRLLSAQGYKARII